MAIGKFQGVMIPTDADRLAGDLDADARPHRGHDLAGEAQASPAKNSKICAARMASPTPSASVLPSSRESSAELVLAGEDLGGGLLQDLVALQRAGAAQAGKAALAAAMARLASSAVPRAYSPTTSAVFAGLTFGAASPPTHSPPIRLLCSSIGLPPSGHCPI